MFNSTPLSKNMNVYGNDYQSKNQSINFVGSPTISKINELSEKMKSLTVQVQEEKTIKNLNFQKALRNIDDKIIKIENQNDSKFKILNEQFNKIHETLQSEELQLDIIDEKKAKEIKLTEKNFSLNVIKEQQDKKEMEHAIISGIDEKLVSLQIDIARERKRREEFEDKRISEIENKFRDLRDAFEGEKQLRDDLSENLIKTFGEEILKLQELLSQEKQTRENQHNNLLQMLEELNESMSNELDRENQIRNQQEEMLLKILEDTCHKIEYQLTN